MVGDYKQSEDGEIRRMVGGHKQNVFSCEEKHIDTFSITEHVISLVMTVRV